LDANDHFLSWNHLIAPFREQNEALMMRRANGAHADDFSAKQFDAFFEFTGERAYLDHMFIVIECKIGNGAHGVLAFSCDKSILTRSWPNIKPGGEGVARCHD
jgi:hypothetical protein